MSFISGAGNQLRVASNTFRFTPSRVGEKGPTQLPDQEAPSEQLSLSGGIPKDADAGKFEVRQLKLDRKSQMLLTAQVGAELLIGPPGFSEAFSSMMKRADGIQIEVPKKGEKPNREAEVWLTSDGQPLMPQNNVERTAVTAQNGTRDRVFDAQVSVIGETVSEIQKPGGAKSALVSMASEGLASAISTQLGEKGQYSSAEVNKAASELGVPMNLKSEQPLKARTLGQTLSQPVSQMVGDNLSDDDVRKPLLDTVQGHWSEQQNILGDIRQAGMYQDVGGEGRGDQFYATEGRQTFDEMGRSLKEDVGTNLLPELLAKSEKKPS